MEEKKRNTTKDIRNIGSTIITEFAGIKENCSTWEYQPNESIYKKNMPITSIFFIETGFVKLLNPFKAGDTIFQLAGNKDIVCLSDLFGSGVYSSDAYAVEATLVKLVDKEILLRKFRANHEFAENVVLFLRYNEILNLQLRLNILLSSPEERLADFLIYLADRIYASNNFKLGLDRMEVATFLGLNLKKLNRILVEFKQLKLVNSKGKSFELLNRKKIEEIAHRPPIHHFM